MVAGSDELAFEEGIGFAALRGQLIPALPDPFGKLQIVKKTGPIAFGAHRKDRRVGLRQIARRR